MTEIDKKQENKQQRVARQNLQDTFPLGHVMVFYFRRGFNHAADDPGKVVLEVKITIANYT